MNQIKTGANLIIHCYKHNGKIHRAWDETMILEINPDGLVCANNHTKVTESDGRVHQTNELAILFFYHHHWFNVIAQLKPKGLFYYCNIATPYLIDDGIIKYIDYDLDLRVFPDGRYRVLDRNEYNYHRKMMRYPPEIDLILKQELTTLIQMKKNHRGPFDKTIIDKYVLKYNKLKKGNI